MTTKVDPRAVRFKIFKVNRNLNGAHGPVRFIQFAIDFKYLGELGAFSGRS